MRKLPVYRGYSYIKDNWVIGSNVAEIPGSGDLEINGSLVQETFIGLGIVDVHGVDVYEGQYLLVGKRIFEIGYRVSTGPFLIDRTEGLGDILKVQDEDVISMIESGEIIGNTLMNTLGELKPKYLITLEEDVEKD